MLAMIDLTTAAVLAVVFYLGVACAMSTLAGHLRSHKRRHLLVVDSRRRRHEYLAHLEENNNGPGHA